jgi:hypothetical protein
LKRKSSTTGNGTHLNVTKSGRKDIAYPRISAGPCRNVYVHRLVAEALLRRRLRSNETVDHKDTNSLNPDPANLQVVSWADHAKITNHRNRRQLSMFERGVDYQVVLDGSDLMERESGDDLEV